MQQCASASIHAALRPSRVSVVSSTIRPLSMFASSINSPFSAHAQEPIHLTSSPATKQFRRGFGKRSELFTKIANSKKGDSGAAIKTSNNQTVQYVAPLNIRGHVPDPSSFDKRFGGLGGNEVHKNKPTPVARMAGDTDEQFYADAAEFIGKVERGFRRLQPANTGLEIVMEGNSRLKLTLLDLYTDLKVEYESMGLRYFSNVSEVNTLYYHVGGGEWRNDKDGHSLEGIIIRDSNRKMTGMLRII